MSSVVAGFLSLILNSECHVIGFYLCTHVSSSKDLVVSGLISADEFWVNRLDKEQGVGGVSDQQETGLPSAFLVSIFIAMWCIDNIWWTSKHVLCKEHWNTWVTNNVIVHRLMSMQCLTVAMLWSSISLLMYNRPSLRPTLQVCVCRGGVCVWSHFLSFTSSQVQACWPSPW